MKVEAAAFLLRLPLFLGKKRSNTARLKNNFVWNKNICHAGSHNLKEDQLICSVFMWCVCVCVCVLIAVVFLSVFVPVSQLPFSPLHTTNFIYTSNINLFSIARMNCLLVRHMPFDRKLTLCCSIFAAFHLKSCNLIS